MQDTMTGTHQLTTSCEGSLPEAAIRSASACVSSREASAALRPASAAAPAAWPGAVAEWTTRYGWSTACSTRMPELLLEYSQSASGGITTTEIVLTQLQHLVHSWHATLVHAYLNVAEHEQHVELDTRHRLRRVGENSMAGADHPESPLFLILQAKLVPTLQYLRIVCGSRLGTQQWGADLILSETLPHLAKADEEIKDVSVIVDHCASLDVCIKLSLALRVQRLIEVRFPLIKFVLAQHDGPASGTCSCQQCPTLPVLGKLLPL